MRPNWPELRYHEWSDTLQTVHLWTQIVGKIKVALMPWTNHSWHVTLFVTPVGLGSGPIYAPERAFAIDFDFVSHRLSVSCDSGGQREISLRPMAVAEFYEQLFHALDELGTRVKINNRPSETVNDTPFDQDLVHRSYDADAVARFHGALVQADRLLKTFRARFTGKCSPVHFFWGGFDLAVTRFSGRAAPTHPGGIPNLPDWITREAYSHEVSSAGFWPGNELLPEAAFYSYAYPTPEGFSKMLEDEPSSSGGPYFNVQLGEFILPYDAVRSSADPDALVLDFLRRTYDAAADLAGWDRAALERPS